MLNVLVRTLLGFVASFGGLFLGYSYFEGLDETNNLILLVGSIPVTTLGFFLIYKAGSFDVNKAKMSKIIKPVQNTGGEERIEENNQMVKEWVHARENSDKLKILSIKAEEEKPE